jgi:hypothetical protein
MTLPPESRAHSNRPRPDVAYLIASLWGRLPLQVCEGGKFLFVQPPWAGLQEPFPWEQPRLATMFPGSAPFGVRGAVFEFSCLDLLRVLRLVFQAWGFLIRISQFRDSESASPALSVCFLISHCRYRPLTGPPIYPPICNNPLDTACFIASELSTPQVHPGHSRRTIAAHCSAYASEARIVSRLSRKIFPTGFSG